jgi:hypothetical protein
MKNFLKLIILAGLLVGGNKAQAAIGDVYSDTFQGVTFTFTQTDANTLTFRLQGDLPLAPDWQTAQFLGAFDLKDLGLDFTQPGGTTATANGPGAVNLAGSNNQLSASAVNCASAGTPPVSICFNISPDFALTDPFNLLYTIDFSNNLNIALAGPHLQIAFTETQNGPKVGSLYSENVPLSTTPGGGSPGGKIPEASALILLGSGLLVIGGIARKFRRKK